MNTKASVLWHLKRYAEALELYDEGIKLDPSNANLRYNKSFSLEKLGRYSECLDILDEAIEIERLPSYLSRREDLLKVCSSLKGHVKKSKMEMKVTVKIFRRGSEDWKEMSILQHQV
jgi:tetratricopeptide (TPR) repeat protein